jgi:hypothetical protein
MANSLTATVETMPAMTRDTIANASRSSAMAAAATGAATWSYSNMTFSGSPVKPRMVKKLIASAASRTRIKRENLGLASSGNATDHPHVLRRCQQPPGSSRTGKAKPRRLAPAIVSS